jgi:UDP-N-acetylmuramoylalanine--D-glutamate ligase
LIAEEVKAAKNRAADPNRLQMHHCGELSMAVETAAHIAQKGDVILLSPGGTSFDAYSDFEERGEHFRTLVNALER